MVSWRRNIVVNVLYSVLTFIKNSTTLGGRLFLENSVTSSLFVSLSGMPTPTTVQFVLKKVRLVLLSVVCFAWRVQQSSVLCEGRRYWGTLYVPC